MHIFWRNILFLIHINPGDVCVSFLNAWNRETKIREILAKLYTIFYMANPECCFNKNIGNEYKENILSLRFLTLGWYIGVMKKIL